MVGIFLIMPQRQRPKPVTEAKLNFYDNIHTITFTERVLDIDTFCKCTLQLYCKPSLWGEKFPKWKQFQLFLCRKQERIFSAGNIADGQFLGSQPCLREVFKKMCHICHTSPCPPPWHFLKELISLSIMNKIP